MAERMKANHEGTGSSPVHLTATAFSFMVSGR